MLSKLRYAKTMKLLKKKLTFIVTCLADIQRDPSELLGLTPKDIVLFFV